MSFHMLETQIGKSNIKKYRRRFTAGLAELTTKRLPPGLMEKAIAQIKNNIQATIDSKGPHTKMD